ncbi:Fe-S cluster assembly protein SufB [Candidatus Micrarchaeota archaeon]|nr:Fe-S cluster assembly protein SufB [Candidatus Micrarchaeota archaeon]
MKTQGYRDSYTKKYGFKTRAKVEYETEKGLSPSVVGTISKTKTEAHWLTRFRLNALQHFEKRTLPQWGADLSEIDFNDVVYYSKATESQANQWEDVPVEIKNTFERLGIPEAERKFLAGVGAQFDSENVYHSLQQALHKKGVVFVDPDTALNPTPERLKTLGLKAGAMKKASQKFREWFGKIVPFQDNKFAALNSAVFSGGSFIYIPPHVDVQLPLQAYFRINREGVGQFERTLIIADEGSKVHYIEGCTAPTYQDKSRSLHTAVVELVALPGAQVRYTTLQNWSNNVYNLVTKRAFAYENAVVEWLDSNIGSRVTMKYPSVHLKGAHAKADILSVTYAGENQYQDAGGKVLHLAPYTSSKIVSKSVSKDGGHSSYRGLLHVAKGATNATSSVRCDALLLDEKSTTDTYPYNIIRDESATVSHEASVGKISEDTVYYLMSRGLSEPQALSLVVNGFLEIFSKELPMEYAVEFNRLIQLEMAGSVG